MGLFGKKKAAAIPLDGGDVARADSAGALADSAGAVAAAAETTAPDAGHMAYDTTAAAGTAAEAERAAAGHSASGRGHGVGEALHTAKESTVSGASVAVLLLWTIAVTGWTAFQVVQNGLVWGKLQQEGFPKPGNPKVPNNGYQGIERIEMKALWAILAIEAALVVFFLATAIALMWVPYISACRQHRRARRTKRSFLPWLLTLVLVAAAWFKLFTLASVLNKMSYQGTWCATNDNLDIKYTFNPKGSPPPSCKLAPMAGGIRQVMVFAMLTIAFHMLMFFWHQPKGTVGKAYGLLPAVLVCAALVLKPVTSLMNVYYTQSHFTKQGNFTFTAEMIVALIEFITAVWLSLYMGWAVHSLRLIPRFTNTLLACCGKKYDDVYYERDERRGGGHGGSSSSSDEEAAEEGGKRGRRRRQSYALRSASKSVVQQYYMLCQLPSVFGFVSPMITFFALGVTNWWIKFDIIVGAALIFIYMVLCGFHRQLFRPSKH